MVLSTQEEKKLLQDLQAKKRGAWETFVQEYSRLIYYSIQRTCQIKSYPVRPDEKEDLFHEIFLNFIADEGKKLRQYQGKGGCSLATWIRTVSTHYVLDYIRKSRRQYFRVEFVEMGEPDMDISFVDPAHMPDNILEDQEKQRLVAEALAELDEDDRYFVELYYKKELSPKQIARILKVSTGSIYTRINRLRTKIKQKIENQVRKKG
jgi:RNA polymerase sigma factor (sigma-70 family)